MRQLLVFLILGFIGIALWKCAPVDDRSSLKSFARRHWFPFAAFALVLVAVLVLSFFNYSVNLL